MAEALPTLFFLNGKLHKKIKIVKSEDLVVAFCFPDEERVQYMYSMVRKNYQKAYTISQASKLLQRPLKELHKFMVNRLIERPKGLEYQISNRKPRNKYWSQDDLYALRDRLYELAPKGPDGFPSKYYRLVSKAELREAMEGDVSVYVRNPDGGFSKVWRAI